MQIVNGKQFLNITYLFISSASLPAASATTPVIVKVPFTSMYVSLLSHKLNLSL